MLYGEKQEPAKQFEKQYGEYEIYRNRMECDKRAMQKYKGQHSNVVKG